MSGRYTGDKDYPPLTLSRTAVAAGLSSTVSRIWTRHVWVSYRSNETVKNRVEPLH
jgi:hypothetical protein